MSLRTNPDAISLYEIKDGAHFHDPELLYEGAVRYKLKDGRVAVRLRRYRPGPNPERENTIIAGTILVLPGDMPSRLKKEGVKALEERNRAELARLQKLALNLRREGMSYAQIAEELHIDPRLARDMTERAMRGNRELAVEPVEKQSQKKEKEGSSKTKTEPTSSGRSIEQRDRDLKAWELRKGGMSFPKIAAEMGFSAPASARAACMRGQKLAGD